MPLPLKKLTNLAERKVLLTQIAEKILKDYKDELSPIQKQLNLSDAEVIQQYLDFDLDPVFTNEIYCSLPLRFIMYMHLFADGSWHQAKQRAVCDLIKKYQLKDIVDLGFGIPFEYVFYCIQNKIKITLNDFDSHAIEFAKVVMSQRSPNWEQYVSLSEKDLCDLEKYAHIGKTFLFLDSIEHVQDPTAILRKYVQSTSDDATFILSLPIFEYEHKGHYIAFKNDLQALDWLKECNLQVVYQKDITANIEVDLFAETMNYEMKEFLTYCTK